MKKISILIAICFNFNLIISQSFLNGDFERTKSIDCDYNLTDSLFNKKMMNVYAFGKKFTFSNRNKGEIDIQTHGCYVNPQNGNWCVGLSADTTTDAIALELSNSLIVGQSYELTFYLFGNTSFNNSLAALEIGESISDSTFGINIGSMNPIAMQWRECKLKFTASQNSKYITVKNMLGVKGWNQVDDFKISLITSNLNAFIDSHDFNVYPNPIIDYAFLKLSDQFKVSRIKIRNVYGKLISESSELLIDLSNVNSGAYHIEIITNKGSAFKRIIKI